MNSIRMGSPFRTTWQASHGSIISTHMVSRAEPAMGGMASACAAAAARCAVASAAR